MARPRKLTPYLSRKIFLMSGYGMTRDQIGEVLGISHDVIDRASKNEEFSVSIARAREIADKQVIDSLFFRAKGYSHPEEKIFTHLISDGEGNQRVEVTRVMTVRHYPPDTNAIGLYLINRRPREFKPASAFRGDEKLPDDGKISRSLTQIFIGVREKEHVAIRSGENELEVLFGKDAAKQLKEKNGIGTDNPKR